MKSFEITRSKAINASVLYAAAVPEDAEVTDSFTRVYQLYNGRWNHADIEISTEKIITYHRPEGGQIALYLSSNGQLFSPEASFRTDIICDQTLAPTKRLGRIMDLRQIEGTLVACGDGGQTYIQTANGTWTPLILELFDERVDSRWVFAVKAKGTTGSEQDAYWRDHPEEKSEKDRRLKLLMANLALHCINGASLQNIYICGKGGIIFYWDGFEKRIIESHTSSSLLDILVEDEYSIWLCGRDGTLLHGNAKSGFKTIENSCGGNFSTITKFRNKIYLSSYADPRGLFVYDGRIRKIDPGPTTHDDVHTVDAVADALWAVGPRSVSRFDGNTWELLPMPT